MLDFTYNMQLYVRFFFQIVRFMLFLAFCAVFGMPFAIYKGKRT